MANDLGSSNDAVLSDSQAVKDVIPELGESTQFMGHTISWYRGATYIDGVKFTKGGFVAALEHISTLPKPKDEKPNFKAVSKLADAFRATWQMMDSMKGKK